MSCKEYKAFSILVDYEVVGLIVGVAFIFVVAVAIFIFMTQKSRNRGKIELTSCFSCTIPFEEQAH